MCVSITIDMPPRPDFSFIDSIGLGALIAGNVLAIWLTTTYALAAVLVPQIPPASYDEYGVLNKTMHVVGHTSEHVDARVLWGLVWVLILVTGLLTFGLGRDARRLWTAPSRSSV